MGKIILAILLIALAVVAWLVFGSRWYSPTPGPSGSIPLFVYAFEGDVLKWRGKTVACPHCKSALKSYSRIDKFSDGIVCENGHRFFIQKKTVSSANSKISNKIIVPKSLSRPSDIIVYWLTDADARSHLNDQLASVLVRVRNIDTDDIRITERPRFDHCPICQGVLSNHESDDVYVSSQICPNNHVWSSRGAQWWHTSDNERVELSAEMTDDELKSTIESWLTNRHLRTNLHRSIESVLRDFKNEHLR